MDMGAFMTSEKVFFQPFNLCVMEIQLHIGGWDGPHLRFCSSRTLTGLPAGSWALPTPQNKGFHADGQTVNKQGTGKWRARWGRLPDDITGLSQ